MAGGNWTPNQLHLCLCGMHDSGLPQSSPESLIALEKPVHNCYETRMKKPESFTDRRQEAEAAKARRLNNFKASAVDSVDAQQRAAAQQAQRAAQTSQNELKAAEKARILKAEAEAEEIIRQAEKKSTDLALAALNHQITLSAEAVAAQAVLDEAGRKAKRDARYASRKARR